MLKAVGALVFVAASGIYAPFGELPAAGCWIENSAGDRFEFTDTLWVWVYDPAGPEPPDFEYEGCAYGADPDSSFHTLTCESIGLDSPVTGTIDAALIIDGEAWVVGCPKRKDEGI